MFCPKCGVKNDDTATGCSACGEVLKRAFDAGKAKEQVKDTATDAWRALQSLGLDPVGGLLKTYQALGSARALGVGIAFGLVFAVCFALAFYRIPQIHLFLVLSGLDGVSGFFKLLIVGLTPFMSLTIACLIGGKAASGKGDLASKAFISGVSLLPLLLASLISAAIGVGNIEVTAILFTVCICMTVMILFNGLTRIDELSDKAASYIVPLMLVLSAWIAKIFLTALLF